MVPLFQLSPYTSLIGFLIGMPTTVATYYQVWRTRREAKEARAGLVISENCLEFVTEDGMVVNLVPLETLHTLPMPGDVVLLPGAHSSDQAHGITYGAYRVERIEHIYTRVTRVERKNTLPGQARLAKSVAHVEALSASAVLEQPEEEHLA